MDLVQYFTILFVLYISGADSLMFYLEPMAKKCLKEEIHKDVLVTGDYELNEMGDQKTNLVVTDTRSVQMRLNLRWITFPFGQRPRRGQ